MISPIYFAPKKFNFIDTKQKMFIPESMQTKINHFWDLKVTENSRFFNGPVYSIGKINHHDNRLDFYVYETNYAHYMYSEEQKFENDCICRSVAAGALLVTSDNFYVLGEMSEHTTYPNIIQCPGGIIDKSDSRNDVFDTWLSAVREVKEEVGLDMNDSSVENTYFIVRKNVSLIGICYKVKISLTMKEVNEIFMGHKDTESELRKLHFIKQDEKEVMGFVNSNLKKVDYINNLLLVDNGCEQCLEWRDVGNLISML